METVGTPRAVGSRPSARPRIWNLEARTERFAADVRALVRTLPPALVSREDARQLLRSSGSVAANCIEANESLGARDRMMRFRIARKEAKESGLWLRLLASGRDSADDQRRQELIQEARELLLILTAIIKRLEPLA
jgi:four helix bundle protein